MPDRREQPQSKEFRVPEMQKLIMVWYSANRRVGTTIVCIASTLPPTRYFASIWRATPKSLHETAGIALIGFLGGELLVAQRGGLIRRRQADGAFVIHVDLA